MPNIVLNGTATITNPNPVPVHVWGVERKINAGGYVAQDDYLIASVETAENAAGETTVTYPFAYQAEFSDVEFSLDDTAQFRFIPKGTELDLTGLIFESSIYTVVESSIIGSYQSLSLKIAISI